MIFSNIRRLGTFLGVQKLEFQYFLWGSEKLIFFGGMKISWIFFFWGGVGARILPCLGSLRKWTGFMLEAIYTGDESPIHLSENFTYALSSRKSR